MGLDYVALAIPFYFLLIGVELWAARRRKQRAYRLADTLTNIGCGIMQQVGMLFLGATLLTGYTFIFEHARLIHFRAGSPVPWLMAFVAVDFLYYWWHRLSHTVNALWAVHMVHHQSEDYNLSVALRQAVFDGLTMWPFFLTMAFLGVPPMAMATAVALSSLFQFWLHTRLVRRLGFLELFLNTPSHHRVHHAINPRYLDKNFGAVLIVWDRLFGTFEEEREPTVYGITHPMRSFNPLWVQVAPWVKLAREARRTPRWRDKLHVWFASPEWHPPGVEVQSQPLAPPGSERKYDVEVSARIRWYLAAHFGLQVVATFALMLWGKALSLPVLVAAASVLLLSLVTGFAERGVMYVRNYGSGVHLPWEVVFQTKERSEVERFCQEQGIAFEWKPDGGLRTRQVCQGVAVHPHTGETLWFNQAHLFHVSSLGASARQSLQELFREEELPRHAHFGDGSTIPEEVLEQVREAFRAECIEYPWQRGDVLLVDNMLVAHGRSPYSGPRRVLVAMAEPFSTARQQGRA